MLQGPVALLVVRVHSLSRRTTGDDDLRDRVAAEAVARVVAAGDLTRSVQAREVCTQD